MPINFLEPSYMSNEYKIYTSNIDYEKKFIEMDIHEKEELEILAELYANNILDEHEYHNSSSYTIPHTYFQDDLPVFFKLYTSKQILYLNNRESHKLRIGLNVHMLGKNYVNEDYMLYTIYYSNCSSSMEEFKNYIANILFFVSIICKEFKYSSLLKYLCHEDEKDKLESISKVHINLFGETLECSVCMDNCIEKTICNHPICLKCYAKLEKKTCPICRKLLKSETLESYVQFFLTNN